MSLPGIRLRRMLARWCDSKTMWQCVDPAIADQQAEYAEARREGRTWGSRWTLLAPGSPAIALWLPNVVILIASVARMTARRAPVPL